MNATRRDRGTNLLEIIVTTAIIGVVMVALLGAIAVVFRTHRGVATTVGEAHDLQQAVNYLPADVQAAPVDPAAYRTSFDGNAGSGCAGTGNTNVLRIDEGSSRIAYTLSSGESGLKRLDRYECGIDGTTLRVTNIADRLAPAGSNPGALAYVTLKTAQDGPLAVERVEMVLSQAHGDEVTVSASPRSEDSLPIAASAPAGTCTNDVLAAAKGFHTFTQQNVHLSNTQVYKTSAIGGNLSWAESDTGNNMIVADYPDISPATSALYINAINWAASSGTLELFSGPSSNLAVINHRDNVAGLNTNTVTKLAGGSYPRLFIHGAGTVRAVSEVIDFDRAFVDLRACSRALAGLPATGCTSCAVHADLWDQNNTVAYPGVGSPGGSYQVNVRIHPSKVNVLNLTADALDSIGNFVFKSQLSPSTSITPGVNNPFIVNVTDAGNVSLDSLPQFGGVAPYTKYILYNFPNASTVTITNGGGGDGVWGTLFAPASDLTVSVKVEGGVIARNWTQNGSSVNSDRAFEGIVNWGS